jgi:hypothetical protein
MSPKIIAQEQSYPALMIGACRAFAFTLTFLGDFEMAREYALRGVKIWRSGVVESPIEEVNAPVLSCLVFEAFLGIWFSGRVFAGSSPTSNPEVVDAIKQRRHRLSRHDRTHRVPVALPVLRPRRVRRRFNGRRNLDPHARRIRLRREDVADAILMSQFADAEGLQVMQEMIRLVAVRHSATARDLFVRGSDSPIPFA